MKPESHKHRFTAKQLLNKLVPNLMLHRGVEKLPLQIKWRRIFILPTKPGLFFGLVVFLMLVASLNFNNNMGLMLTFLLVGLAQVALYRVFYNLRNLTINHVTAKPVFVGEKAEFIVSLSSSDSKYDICIKNNIGEQRLSELPADTAQVITCQFATTERGWLQCGKVKILSAYPFGLFYAWIWSNLEAKCLVYPMPEPSPPPLPRHAASEGETTVITHGEDFHGLKPFQSGDSMRLIAWKRTAQTGELISRELQQTHGKKLLLDFSQINLAAVELKLSRLTAWVLLAYQQRLDYCLKLPQFNSGFGYSSQHHLACLKALALYGKSK
ncbi:hypothetical protein MNBD_GAMMA01-1139 [hydrothermal vent metagenome]|uniref:Uncharacterized protein n=1 Tax=hydrothermal vent metagenome TaxID=652676 RepID=A0A3B0VB19_9ZZZZ